MSNKTLIRTALAKVRDTLLGGWYFGDEESKSRACHLQFNWTNNVMANLVGGNFFAGIMLLLGADDGFIGLMSMFIFASNCLQIFSPLILEHFPRRKTLLIVMRLVIQTINIAFIGAIPFHTKGAQQRMIGKLLFTASALPGSPQVVGFENHSGKTWLGSGVEPLGRVLSGFGNNGQDGTEGAHYKNVFGTYSHGPLLPKNPAFCDHLLLTALERKYGKAELAPLDDSAELLAHDEMCRRLTKG